MTQRTIPVTPLGQTGFRFEFPDVVVYIDPYLSNSVQEKESPDLERLMEVPIPPENIPDADWLLITHEHRDHCDLDTLLPISESSPQCQFICPKTAGDMLKRAGIAPQRVHLAPPEPTQIAANLSIQAVPSAHPEVETDPDGSWRWVGYLIRYRGQTIYHAGDTAANATVIAQLRDCGNIDVAFLPVNEQNYYRDRRGIIGNMSIREAFQFAEDINTKTVIPTHWDMFAVNQVFREEIELLYEKLQPPFKMTINPTAV